MKTTTKLWFGIMLLVFLSPLGLILPEYFNSRYSWGEWSREEIYYLIGYIPRGFKKLSDLWKAPLPDYAFRALGEKGLFVLSFAYIISAIVGIAVIVMIVLLLARMLAKKGD